MKPLHFEPAATFLGKLAFTSGSTCLAACMLPDGGQAPAMTAFAQGTRPARVSAYQLSDGSVRLQIDERWIGLDRESGCLVLNRNLAQAATLRLAGECLGQGWEMLVEDRWLPVVFHPQETQALLTIRQKEGAESCFEPVLVTPSLTTLVATRQGRGADLSNVVLDGTRLCGVDFTGACFSGASLQGSDLSDCLLSTADFSGARLEGASLAGARLERASLVDATLTGCRLDGAVLDGANLTGVFALKASLRDCSLKNIVASNANFTAANLSDADLSQAQLDAKVHLFSLDVSHIDTLQCGLADAALLAAFQTHGLDLPADTQVRERVARRCWQIGARSEGYTLIGTAERIEVFRTDAALRPAIFYRAICIDTRASGAHLSGADLRGVQWCGSAATLDHADLEGAVLSHSLLASLDLSGALLSGADLTGCVLVDARMSACTILCDAGSRAFSLDGAQIQGVDFSDTSLVDALLINAGVSMAQGVPLFTLPPSAWDDLTPAGIATLASRFALAGYPLGTSPSIEPGTLWLLDDAIDPVSASIRQVADPIVRPAPGTGIIGPYGYAGFRLVRCEQWVQVFGMGSLLMRDWPAYPSGVAFKATAGLVAAMSEHSIGPAGYLKQALTANALDSEAFFTAAMPRLS